MQLLVPGIPAGFGAQDRHGDVRGRLPVGVERLGPCVEEAVARQVPCPEPSNTSSWKARPRALVARTSLLPLRTNAGPRTTASSARVRPSLGTHVFALRLRTGRAAPSAARARSKRCSRSASSSCSARATDSRTASETPASLGARGPVQARPQPRHHRLADRPREEGPAAVPPCLRPPERRDRRGRAGGSAALGVLLRPAQWHGSDERAEEHRRAAGLSMPQGPAAAAAGWSAPPRSQPAASGGAQGRQERDVSGQNETDTQPVVKPGPAGDRGAYDGDAQGAPIWRLVLKTPLAVPVCSAGPWSSSRAAIGASPAGPPFPQASARSPPTTGTETGTSARVIKPAAIRTSPRSPERGGRCAQRSARKIWRQQRTEQHHRQESGPGAQRGEAALLLEASPSSRFSSLPRGGRPAHSLRSEWLRLACDSA